LGKLIHKQVSNQRVLDVELVCVHALP